MGCEAAYAGLHGTPLQGSYGRSGATYRSQTFDEGTVLVWQLKAERGTDLRGL